MTARLAINWPGEPTIAEIADPTPNTRNPIWSPDSGRIVVTCITRFSPDGNGALTL